MVRIPTSPSCRGVLFGDPQVVQGSPWETPWKLLIATCFPMHWTSFRFLSQTRNGTHRFAPKGRHDFPVCLTPTGASSVWWSWAASESWGLSCTRARTTGLRAARSQWRVDSGPLDLCSGLHRLRTDQAARARARPCGGHGPGRVGLVFRPSGVDVFRPFKSLSFGICSLVILRGGSLADGADVELPHQNLPRSHLLWPKTPFEQFESAIQNPWTLSITICDRTTTAPNNVPRLLRPCGHRPFQVPVGQWHLRGSSGVQRTSDVVPTVLFGTSSLVAFLLGERLRKGWALVFFGAF